MPISYEDPKYSMRVPVICIIKYRKLSTTECFYKCIESCPYDRLSSFFFPLHKLIIRGEKTGGVRGASAPPVFLGRERPKISSTSSSLHSS